MPEQYEYNLALDGEQLETDEGLQTRVLISLLTWARADAEDPVPDPKDLKGWWGDSYSDVPARKLGSKLWIVQNMPASEATLQLAKRFVTEALEWMVEDGLVDEVTVDELEIQNGSAGKYLTGRIGLKKPGELAISFVRLWDVTLAG